jgi:hypothetical protein
MLLPGPTCLVFAVLLGIGLSAIDARAQVDVQRAERPGGQEPASAASQTAPRTDLDELMEKVLAHRDETWRRLHDYVLDEAERVQILGPGGIRLHGLDRRFTWYVRDGILVRSPVSADGVRLSEEERRKYEEKWLKEEQERAKKRGDPDGKEGASVTVHTGTAAPIVTVEHPTKAASGQPVDGDALSLMGQGGEPRFISEAYFLEFKFEPGNYYLVGREELDGRQVLRIEYYPRRLFNDSEEAVRDARKDRERDEEEEFERKFNKVALVTLWVDQAALQIVKYTFDNVDFGFLPLRSFVRLDTVRASMVMGQFLDGVWLPREIDMEGAASLATGTFRIRYGREFSDYRQAETSATIRHIETPKP